MSQTAKLYSVPTEPAHPLPFAEGAERTLLATILAEPKWLDNVAAMLDADRFYIHANRILFKAMLELRALGSAVDIITVRQWLDKHGKLNIVTPTYLAEILNLEGVTVRVDEYAKLVNDCWRLRQFHDACYKAAIDIRIGQTPDDVQSYLEQVVGEITNIAHATEVSGAEWFGTTLANTFLQVRERLESGRKLALLPESFPFERFHEKGSSWPKRFRKSE